MTVKIIDKATVNSLLSSLDMMVGDWERIEYSCCRENRNSISYQAPRDARKLYCFSQQVATWLPSGAWKLLQIDTSTVLAWDEAFLLGRLFFETFDIPDFSKLRSFLFEFGDEQDTNRKSEIIIANVIYLFLMFECHGYITSSAGKKGEILAIQDGFVGFISRESDISGARAILNEYENNPIKLPKWMCQLDTFTGEHITR